MGIETLLKTRNGRILISMLWGFGLACLFRKVCTGRNCIVYKAPSPSIMTNNIYSHNSKCYKYQVETTQCTKDAIQS